MKEIQLTKGNVALIDDEDFELVSKYNWFSHKEYAARTVRVNGEKITILMHRFIMGCVKGDGKMLDHKDGNGLNNQRSNLRFCTSSENQKNKKAWGSSKYLGVSRHTKNFKKYKKSIAAFKDYSYTNWKATISINGRPKHIGGFTNEIDAAKAYNEAALKYHGEFARLNKI